MIDPAPIKETNENNGFTNSCGEPSFPNLNRSTWPFRTRSQRLAPFNKFVSLCQSGAPRRGETTAPSKRICLMLPDYVMPVAGAIVADAIGLPKIRNGCADFNSWIEAS